MDEPFFRLFVELFDEWIVGARQGLIVMLDYSCLPASHEDGCWVDFPVTCALGHPVPGGVHGPSAHPPCQCWSGMVTVQTDANCLIS